MSQSLVKNYIHLVFSTKHREPILDETIQPELFRYIAGICTHCDCCPVKIGGHTDHIHALFLLNKKIALVKIVEEVKSHSSKWIKAKGTAYSQFYWQRGYGAFSVNPSEVDVTKAYIENQKEYTGKFRLKKSTTHSYTNTVSITTRGMCGSELLFRPFRALLQFISFIPGPCRPG